MVRRTKMGTSEREARQTCSRASHHWEPQGRAQIDLQHRRTTNGWQAIWYNISQTSAAAQRGDLCQPGV
jgi:hypothetical protein